MRTATRHFFSKWRQKLCPNLLIMEFYRKLKSYNSTDYSPGMISLKLLASVVSQTLAPFLILSKSTTIDESLLRKTLAFLSFQIFQEVRRVRVAMASRFGVDAPVIRSHHSRSERGCHCRGSMEGIPSHS